jgi:hypothetical protein
LMAGTPVAPGRFSLADDRPNRSPAVTMGSTLWRRKYPDWL